jgi:hypothetical protein
MLHLQRLLKYNHQKRLQANTPETLVFTSPDIPEVILQR